MSSTEKSSPNYTINSVRRAVQVLRAFSEQNRTLSLTEIHEITGIQIPTLQRLLFTLTKERLLVRNKVNKRYELGLDFVFFAHLVRKNSNLLLSAEPIMKELNDLTTESVTLNIVEGNERKCISSFDSKHELVALTYAGHASPLYAGASAKTLLAYFDETALENYLDEVQLEAITGKTIVNKDELHQELKEIRKQGYGISDGERVKGAVSISAPILNSLSEVVASLSITIPDARAVDYDLDHFIKLLKQKADQLVKKLSFFHTDGT